MYRLKAKMSFPEFKMCNFHFRITAMVVRLYRYLLLLFILPTACTTNRQRITLDYTGYRIEKQLPADSNMNAFLAPYAANIHATMNRVIGVAANDLVKQQPECNIGNFMADCMMIMAEKKFHQKPDAAFMNYWGIRTDINKGDITVGKIYELMPFDNLVVLQEVKGNVLQSFLDLTAEKGGWPVSGVTMTIRDKKAVNVLIGGKPLDINASYTIANSDYIANGGDDCAMLKNIPQQNKGYLVRDALIEYISWLTQNNKPVDWKIDGRVKAN